MKTILTEDDLLLDELYKFIVKSMPSIIFNNEKILTVGKQVYYAMIYHGDFMTIKRFIGEYYKRGLKLIFDEDIDYCICLNVCNDGLEIGIIDSNLYYNHIANKTCLSFDKKTNEIKKWEKHGILGSGKSQH